MKRILGLVQTASENKRVIAAFLRELGERGFPLDQPILAVLDGAKGLRAAVREVFGDIPPGARVFVLARSDDPKSLLLHRLHECITRDTIQHG